MVHQSAVSPTKFIRVISVDSDALECTQYEFRVRFLIIRLTLIGLRTFAASDTVLRVSGCCLGADDTTVDCLATYDMNLTF
jgi:hypothetical protein